ncbi:ABC transporter permease [Amycolatopsis keratiniphila]|uniref:ABC transporter permease n=1 Tax=Amycolatopsis keratiniphila TaxID=129921 RepID=UPI00087DB10A|nr:ABC transporter permease [Amycolatopsis keratiniphila]OLZ46809.1 ABC transporter [Amycolatopsis keratiniphila subsp. nogabecina]SDU39510.1 ABC-2 type transport system permease protein [Amycolatopsis keratiniphila]
MNPTYLKTEIVRTFRSTRFVLFAVAFPVLMFLLQANVFASGQLNISGVIMVNMMAFGAFSAAMTSGAKLAIERSTGWQRQLRLTPLTGAGYLGGKALSAMLVALPSLLLVPLVGVLVQGVHLDAAGWLRLVLGIWLGAIPLVLLGLLLGQFGTPESMQPLNMIVMMGMGFLGGLWIPIDGMPSWMADLAQVTPTYWLIQLVRPVVTDQHTVSLPAALGVLAAWTAVLGTLVIRRYRKDSARV